MFTRKEQHPFGQEAAERPEMGQERAGGLVPRDVIEAEPGGAEAVGVGGKAVGTAASVETRRRGVKGLRARGTCCLGGSQVWCTRSGRCRCCSRSLVPVQPGTPHEVGRPQARARQVLPVAAEVVLCREGGSPPGTPGEAVLQGERGEAGGLGRALLRRAHR